MHIYSIQSIFPIKYPIFQEVSHMVPVIGIVSCGFIEEKQFVSQPYIHAIESSGGLPIIIPCTRAVPRHPSLQFCDAFLFCGGDDITPLLMGEDPSPKNGTTDLKTDFFHLNLMKTLLASGRPMLAICRGMQILNITMGGTIYQDASLYPKVHISHIQRSKKRSDISHKVFFQKPSILYNIYGKYAFTNSFHHQYIKDPAPHLIPAGRTSDQVIEALEADCHPFLIGVQWHPECMYDTSAGARRLFDRFIHTASEMQD